MAGFRKKAETTFVPPIVVKDHKTYEFKGGVIKYSTVRWHYNGKVLDPVFEKREYYQTDAGPRMGKAKGLNLQDFKWLQENWEEVITAMTGGTAPEIQPEPETAALGEAHDPFA